MSMVEEETYAAKIHDYWLGRGYDVGVHVGYQPTTGHHAQVVRSSLVNGLPRNLHPTTQLDVAIPIRRAIP